MAPKADPRLKKDATSRPATGAQATAPEVRKEKRQLSQSAGKLASISKKTKEEAYDPKALAVPLLSTFRDRRGGSPSGSSVTTIDADPEPGSDTDVEAASESGPIGEAVNKLQQLGRPEVC